MLDKAGLEARARSSNAAAASVPSPHNGVVGAEIFIVDDDPMIRELLNTALSSAGYRVTSFSDVEAFCAAARSRAPPACVVLDVLMPGCSGSNVLKEIGAHNYAAPIIAMSRRGGIPTVVEAIRNGAFDFIQKPFAAGAIVDRVRDVIAAWTRHRLDGADGEILAAEFPGRETLTVREAEVLAEIIAAASNKEAGQHLRISPRTIEVHRAHIMTKLGAKNTADLVRIALTDRQH